MKIHVGTDKQGRAHSSVITDTDVHDSQMMDDLLYGEETEAYGDKARKETMEREGACWRVNRKASLGKELNIADRSFNK